LAKIAVGPNGLTSHVLVRGDGWAVTDFVCTSGPQDRPFEEQHSCVSIAIVASGTFQYRSGAGRALMTPGSLLLGNAGQCFECGHEHGTGDRCISFAYHPDYFERLAADAGLRGRTDFNVPRLPPLRVLSPLIARASHVLAGPVDVPWEELSIELAAQAVQLARGLSNGPASAPPGATARVTSVVRMMERHPDAGHAVGDLARQAGLSPYHFLRIFESLTGVTPHQYVLRMRLRQAALALATGSARILDIALQCGFGDLSNFNRAFRNEFGCSPRAYRNKDASDFFKADNL
jgi:AraC family transcriptional regulator